MAYVSAVKVNNESFRFLPFCLYLMTSKQHLPLVQLSVRQKKNGNSQI